jgi:hypothetical protein
MKKILGIIFAISALFASCTSPYNPEYRPVIALGANTDAVVCESGEAECSFNVISNVEYEARIISGSEWLSFVDTDAESRIGNGNGVLTFHHKANNNHKRVAEVKLSSGSREFVVKIKQKGFEADYLNFDTTDEMWGRYFIFENNTRMSLAEEAKDYSLRLSTSCLDHEISLWTDYPKAIVDFKVENKYVHFHLNENTEGQPRIIAVELSYVDGWGDKRVLPFSIRQDFTPNN